MGRPIPVSVATAEKRHMTDVISAVGNMDYLDMVPVNTEVVGIVLNVGVQAGDQVMPGETLLTVSTGGQEARQAQLDLDLKKSMYDKAKSDYDRDDKAFKNGLISATAYDATLASYREAKVNMEKAQETLNSTIRSRTQKIMATVDPRVAVDGHATGTPAAVEIKQPDLAGDLTAPGQRIPIIALTAGTVVQVNASVGQNLPQPTNQLMMIGDRLVFNANVDQRYFGSVHIGDRAKIYLQALDGQPLTGRVIRIRPQISANPTSAATSGAVVVPYSFAVSLEIDANKRKLAGGMNGYCLFAYDTEKLAIPQAALIRYSGGEGVVGVVTQENRVQFVPVTYSIDSGGWIAIDSGIQPGTRVVLAGQTGLREGDTVTIQ